MPPDMSTTPRPLIPTGSPPWAAMPSVNTNASSWSTSMNTVVSGWDRLTPSPCASRISRPISTLSWVEVSGNLLSLRRARTANVPEVPFVSAIAAAEMASGALATPSGMPTRASPGTSRPRPPRLAALLSIGDAEQDHPLALAQVDRHAEVPHRGADVAVQDLLELLSVPPLEHDLAQLEQDAQLIGGGGIWHSPSLPADSGFMGPA